ncbi:unnamed protein product [Miscanthus lutarioriparius]|uniref:DUF4220 domain-containing protein n=1 Tax=Miscanthus lutarioriparius TaxID=422564 RepID=A0A811RFP9_9POAL|nr:unnamed protein product [Miscanthus lutarioriparius]
MAATSFLLTMERLFKLDTVTRMASVELWVLLTTLLLVVRFLIDFKGPWFGNPRRTIVVLILETLNQNMVIYTMGLMQLSGARKVNDYFQVWAVLLVTLQYSVKIGRPYTRSKQVPLLDLMSSFWSANLLRVQTFYLLRFPLWTIWSLNAVRIIVLFTSTGKGETNNQESMRLVTDYMSYEDTLSTSTSTSTLDEQEQNKKSAMTMSGYKYLVYGEHRVLKEVQEGSKREGKRTLSSCFRKRRQQVKSESSSSYKIELKPDGVHKEQLVTIETIWKDDNGSGLLGAGDAAGHRRDLCLSFALYKLLRRGFYDLPIHEHEKGREVGKKKMRRLVFDYVLWDTDTGRLNTERAFRITVEELSFLRDLFYSKHATVFAGGLWVPLRSLLLSLCLATATGYIAYPARYIPERMDPADRNRITHGVFITRLMIGIIVLKEMLEIVLYLWSRWAKVLMLCMYAQLQHRRPVVEAAMRWFVLCVRAFSSCLLWLCRRFCFCCKAKQTTTVRQQNLLVEVHGTAGLDDHIKVATLNQIRVRCLDDSGGEGIAIHSYFSNAFGSSKSNTSQQKVVWPRDLKEVDTHIILVWHIATSLCEIYCLNEVKRLQAAGRRPQPFLRRPRTRRPKGPSAAAPPAQQHDDDDGSSESAWSEHYSTAVTLSNYCVYLVSKALVPDNRLVARKVLGEVIREIDYVVGGDDKPWEKLLRSIKLEDVYNRLMKTVDKPCKNTDHRRQGRSPAPADVEEAATPPDDDHHQVDDDDDEEEEEGDDYEDLDIGCSLTRMGAVLGKDLDIGQLLDGVPHPPGGQHWSGQALAASRRRQRAHHTPVGAAYARRLL